MKKKETKKKKKIFLGFTLIELLAVILILGIIALIAIPQVNKVIETSRKGAAEVSAKSYLSVVTQTITTEEISGNKTIPHDGIVDIDDIKVEMSGSKPTNGSVVISKGEVISAELVINGRTVLCENIDSCKAIDGYVYFIGETEANRVSDGTTKRPNVTNAYLKYVVVGTEITKYQACVFDNSKEVCIFPDEPEVSLKKLYDVLGIPLKTLYPEDGSFMVRNLNDSNHACIFMDKDVQCFFNGTLSLSVREDGSVDAADTNKLYNCTTKTKSCNRLHHS